MTLSLRRYGHSEGTPSEEGVYLDAEAVLDFALANGSASTGSTPGEPKVFVFGRSIGGAVAIELARRRPRQASTLPGTFVFLPQYWGASLDGSERRCQESQSATLTRCTE